MSPRPATPPAAAGSRPTPDIASGRVASQAGAAPQSIAVAPVARMENTSTSASTGTCTAVAADRPAFRMPTRAPRIQTPGRPASPPATASTEVSTSNCRTSLALEAPRHRRTPNSPARARALASRRLARLAHATSRTSTARLIATSSGSPNVVPTVLKPRAPSPSRNCPCLSGPMACSASRACRSASAVVTPSARRAIGTSQDSPSRRSAPAAPPKAGRKSPARVAGTPTSKRRCSSAPWNPRAVTPTTR